MPFDLQYKLGDGRRGWGLTSGKGKVSEKKVREWGDENDSLPRHLGLYLRSYLLCLSLWADPRGDTVKRGSGARRARPEGPHGVDITG